MSSSEQFDPSSQGSSSPRGRTGFRILIGLGCIGLALHLSLSLWAFQRRVGPNLRIEHERVWIPGESTPLRVEMRDADLQPMELPELLSLSLRLDDADAEESSAPLRSLGTLSTYRMRRDQAATRAEGMVQVPTDWPLGSAQLHVFAKWPDGTQIERRCDVLLSATATARVPTPVTFSDILKDADPSEAQPEGKFFEIRPSGDLRAPFQNQLWVRMLDTNGSALAGWMTLRRVAGEWEGEDVTTHNGESYLFRGPIPNLGVFPVSGSLSSDVVRFAIQYWSDAEAFQNGSPALASRMIQLRAMPGGARLSLRDISVSQPVKLDIYYESLAKTRRASLDIYDAQGRWISLISEPQWPSQEPFVETPALKPGYYQIEASAGVRTAHPGVPFARFWVDDASVKSAEASRKLASNLIAIARANASSWPASERDVHRKHLDDLATHSFAPADWEALTDWLVSIQPPSLYASPQVHDTYQLAQAELKSFKEMWALRLRILLWGGGALYIVLVGFWILRTQRADARAMQAVLDREDEEATGLLALERAIVWKSLGVIAVLAFCLGLLAIFMESLVSI